MGCCFSHQAAAKDSPARGGAGQRAVVDYDSIDTLWNALESRDILLVRGSWLVAQAELGQVLPRRQECPPEAFIELEDLKRIYEESTAKPKFAATKRAPIVSVSHFWRERQHPDARGETLQTLAQALKDNFPRYMECGLSDVGVFLDWCSAHQAPRSEAEERSFGNALKWINVWYAHALTTVYLVTDSPAGIVPYHDRGWTSFEYQLAWLIKLADKDNVWPQVVNLGSETRGRPALAPPDAFWPGRAFGDKAYTNGADRAKVAKKFEETCHDVLGSATELDFDSVGWGELEVGALGAVLPLCQRLGKMYLNRNPFSHLPESLGQLGALKELHLSDCGSLAALPESLGQLGALEQLHLSRCGSLAALLESLGQLRCLEHLDLSFCYSLAALPESLGQLGALKELNLSRCSSLAALPESLGQLGALEKLNLSDCFSLAALPESLGQLRCLEQLYLRDCGSLAALPESLGQLGALKLLDLRDCGSLAALPESLGKLEERGCQVLSE